MVCACARFHAAMLYDFAEKLLIGSCLFQVSFQLFVFPFLILICARCLGGRKFQRHVLCCTFKKLLHNWKLLWFMVFLISNANGNYSYGHFVLKPFLNVYIL